MSYVRSDPIIPSERDTVLARKAEQALAGSDAPNVEMSVKIAGREAAALDLPPIVARLLMALLRETAAGNAVSLVPVEAEVTTHQAAALLNVSRPYLIGLVDNGTLPARLVGKHRRLPLSAVLAYKAEHFAKRSKVLDELVAHDQDLGLL